MHSEESTPAQIEKFPLLATILVAGFIFVVCGVGGYWVGSTQQESLSTALQASPKPSWLPSATPVKQLSPTPTIGTSQTNLTSNWKTYRNGEYGFEVKYPPGWYIHYKATQKDILETLDSNQKYHLDRPIKLVSWQDGDTPYPETGYISFLLYTDLLTEQFIVMRTTSYRDVEVKKHVINGRTFTEISLSSYLGKEPEDHSFSFSKGYYTAFPYGAFQTLNLSGIGYDLTREQLEEILEGMVNSLKITQ